MPSETDELHWRETYFILFPRSQRPSLEKVEHALGEANHRMKLENLAADSEGLLESLLVESPEDHAAVEVSYEAGDAVIEQNLQWAKQLRKQLNAEQLQLLMKADARLDVAHFERLPASSPSSKQRPEGAAFGDDDPFDEDNYGSDDFGDESFGDFDDPDYGDAEFDDENMDMLDPTCLLTVVETLAALTHGLAFDPASGELME